MAKSRKQIAFDLDTNALKEYFPIANWRKAYDVIKRHMVSNGFQWRQGSVYVSDKPMSPLQASNIIKKLVDENLWLNVCMRDCVQTNVSREHSLNQHFNKAAQIEKRAERGSKSLSDYGNQIKEMKAADGQRPSEASRSVKGKSDKGDTR